MSPAIRQYGKQTNRHPMNKIRFALLCLTALLCLLAAGVVAGCTTTTIKLKDGSTFTRTSFLNSQSIGKVDVKLGDGQSVNIQGYNSEQTAAAVAALNAAAAALKASP